jgi:hypothetical protein
MSWSDRVRSSPNPPQKSQEQLRQEREQRQRQQLFSQNVQTLLAKVNNQIKQGSSLNISSNYVRDEQYQVSGYWDPEVVQEAMRLWSQGPRDWGYHAMCGEKSGWRQGTTQANFICNRVQSQPNKGRHNVHVNVRT